MKTISFIECRTCGATVHSGDKDVTIKPGEELTWAVLKKEKCDFCKQNPNRTTGQRKLGGKTRHL